MIGHRIRAGRIALQKATPATTVAADGVPQIADTARVAAGAMVTGRGRLGGQAVAVGAVTVTDDARVLEHAILAGTATVRGRATVSGWATVIEQATVDGDGWVFGRAAITGRASVGGHVVIGDGADITAATDFETHRLSWGETITLYRCEAGTVGIGRDATNHGPIIGGRTHLIDPSINIRVAELAELWANPTKTA